MYNDYYLEQINNKLITNNNLLNEIIQNQETLISGDRVIREQQYTQIKGIAMIEVLIAIILMYLFIVRSLKS